MTTGTVTKNMGASYTADIRKGRAYRAWVVLDFPVQPPSIINKIKGSENEIYNSIRLIPLDGDKWAWERYFKAKSRPEACSQMGKWIRSYLKDKACFKTKSEPWNKIAFVEDSHNELFYCSDMELMSDAFTFVPLDVAQKVIERSKGELGFNDKPNANAQRYSFKRLATYKKPKDVKLKDNLFKCRNTDNYYVYFAEQRYNLMTSDEKRAWSEATKVVKNIRRGLPPFDHRSGHFFDNREQNKKIDSDGQTHEKIRKGCSKNQHKNKNRGGRKKNDGKIQFDKKISTVKPKKKVAERVYSDKQSRQTLLKKRKERQKEQSGIIKKHEARIKELEKRLKEKGVIV